MTRQIVNVEKLAEAQEAADTAQEAATLTAERIAEAVALVVPSTDTRRAQTLRLDDAAWRQLKILAIDERKTVHDLVLEGINLVFEKRGQPPVA